jgi:hypothetical protein
MAKQKLSEYNLSTLLELEKASRIVCMKYESASKNYDGSIINNDQYVLFKKYNDFRSEVISEMEKRLNEEIDE